MTEPANDELEVSYAAGGWVALAGAGTWLLLEVSPGSPEVTAVWPLLRSGADAESVLDVLVSGGIRSAPGFALVRLSDKERRALVRGGGTVRLLTPEPVDLVATAGTAWADQIIADDVTEVLLVGGDVTEPAVELPMGSGVMTAGLVRIRAASEAADVPSPPRRRAGARKRVAERAAVPEAAEPEVVQPPVVVPEPESPDEAVVVELPRPEPAVVESPAESPVKEPEKTASEQEPSSSYDFLFGATQLPPRPEELAPIPDLEPEKSDETAQQPTPVPEVPPAVSGTTQGWSTSSVQEVGGLIDSVPGFGGSPAPTAAPRVQVPAAEVLITDLPEAAPAVGFVEAGPVEEQNVRTVSRSQLLAEPAQAQPTGPNVLAVRCPKNHLTSAHGARCRVCGSEVPEQQAFEVARPTLGTLRLSTRDLVTLDRGVLFGRAPDGPVGEEAHRSNVVRLASADISRNHAEVVLDGWTVFVQDLGSTNGTTVTLPGQPPVRLRTNDPFALEPGSVVTLAEVVTMTFEVSG